MIEPCETLPPVPQWWWDYGQQAILNMRVPYTTDAREWAKDFIKTIERNPGIPTDEGAMISWFASAIMAGYDHGQRTVMKEVSRMAKEATERLVTFNTHDGTGNVSPQSLGGESPIKDATKPMQ